MSESRICVSHCGDWKSSCCLIWRRQIWFWNIRDNGCSKILWIVDALACDAMAWCRTCVDVGSQKAVVVMCVRYCTEVRMEQATEYWRQECLRNSFEMRHVSWCVNWDSCGRPRNRGSTLGRGRSFITLQSAQSSSGAHPASCPAGTASVWLGIKRLAIGWPFTAIRCRIS